MKILYVAHATPWTEYSGVPLVAGQYSKLATEKGFDIAMLTPSFDNAYDYNNKKNKFNNILDLKWPAIRNWSLDAFTSNKNFDKILGYKIPFSPDIIHILDWINLHPSILIALKNLNVPIVRHIFNFEDLCYFHQPIFRHNNQKHCEAPLTPNDCASCISKNTIKREKKFFKKIKYFLFNEERKIFNLAKSKLLNRSEVFTDQVNEFYNHIIFPSNSFAEYFKSHIEITKPFSVISLGMPSVSTKPKKLESNKTIKCIFAGGADFRKGWKITEEVFEKIFRAGHKNVRLRVYGHKKKTSKSKLRKYKEVEFFDTFKIEKITEIFSWADVGIIPTYFETFCRTVRHFLQANVVPIASEAFGIPDIIKSNVNGIILNKPYAESLYDELIKIISEPEIIMKLKLNLKKIKIDTAEEEFDKILDVYQLLLNNKR